jgi:hypothetical protein
MTSISPLAMTTNWSPGSPWVISAVPAAALTGSSTDRPEAERDALDRGDRELGERGHLAKQPDHGLVDDRDVLEPADPEVHGDRDDGQDQAGDHEGSARLEGPDERGGEQAAGHGTQPDDRLQDRQHRSPIVVGARPLQDREQGDVIGGIRDADDEHRRHGDLLLGEQAEDGKGQAPEHEPDDLGPDQSLRPAGRQGEDRAEQATEPERCGQQAGALLAHPEEVDRRDDDERIEEPAGHDLAVRAEDRPREQRLAPDGPDAVEKPESA